MVFSNVLITLKVLVSCVPNMVQYRL